MTRSRLTAAAAPWMSLLVLLSSASLVVLRPDRWLVWLAALPVLVTGWVVWLVAPRAARPSAPAGTLLDAASAADQIRPAITFAGLVLLIPLLLALTTELGLLEVATRVTVSTRLTGVLAGLVLAAYANVLPKHLTPLSAQRCGSAEVQAYRRFAGWSFVLAGVSSAIVWVTAPLASAAVISIGFVGTGLVLVVLRYLRLRTAR